MDIKFINAIKSELEREKLSYFSEYSLSYTPENWFFLHSYYEILARELYIYLCQTKLNKKDFIKKITQAIYDWFKDIELSNKIIKAKAKRAANHLWKIIPDKLEVLSNDDIITIKVELCQKFRHHCCSELNCTDNASRRYFFRSPIVYVRAINTYVITNYRKYVYDEEHDEYFLDETITYELLDYCPFCGADLKELRRSTENDQKIIEDAIIKWRDAGECLVDDGESYIQTMTFYGMNAYDSFHFISKVLATKYSQFDDEYGVDKNGRLRRSAGFINIKKLFHLAHEHNILRYFDPYPLQVERSQVCNYFVEKFNKRENFSEDDIITLICLLDSVFWDMFHNPSYFDELVEN